MHMTIMDLFMKAFDVVIYIYFIVLAVVLFGSSLLDSYYSALLRVARAKAKYMAGPEAEDEEKSKKGRS